MFADAHVHLTDERFSGESLSLDRADTILRQSIQHNISLFLEAGVSPDGWSKQILLSKKYPDHVKYALGLHPYFIALSDREDCETGLNELSRLILHAHALGETGLDFRDQYVQNYADDRQIEFFENQYQLAVSINKPLVLHIVRAHEEALKVIRLWGPTKATQKLLGMVHAFNGSYEVAKQYLDQGFLISVGGAMTFEKNQKLIEAVKKIPLEMLLLESDSPDQKPFNWKSELNTPESVLLVAASVAQIKNRAVEEVLKITTNNFKTLFT